MYRPLPSCLTIMQSTIDGLGIHATKEIPAKTTLGHTHYDSVDHGRVRSPLGGFINHSNNPNCFITTDAGDRTLYAIKPIKKGDELTVFYRFKGYNGIIGDTGAPDVGC